ncbi:MAG: hypothetical protein AB7G17_00845 [Phycisphaerales bacterium]
MKNPERLIVVGLFIVLVFGWLGFLLHVSPDFAGSGLGAVFGILGAALMLVPLGYAAAKRIGFLRARLTTRLSLRAWLSIHIYTGIVGALLALIHTGHKYASPLGIALIAAMLLVVVSGVVLRYLVPFVSLDLKDKLNLLQTARGDLDNAWGVIESGAADARHPSRVPLLTSGLASLGVWFAPDSPRGQVINLAASVADLEYSIRTHELMNRWFSYLIVVHILLSVVMYGLLGIHVWSGVYFGLRWLQ